MNHMEKVAELLGVELGERFKIYGRGGEYHLETTGLWFRNGFCESASGLLEYLLTGEWRIMKQPWVPSDGGDYWSVSPNGEIEAAEFTAGYTMDELLVRIGNCYRTLEEITPELQAGWVAWYKGGPNPAEVRRE